MGSVTFSELFLPRDGEIPPLVNQIAGMCINKPRVMNFIVARPNTDTQMTLTSWLRGWRTVSKTTFIVKGDQISVATKHVYERPPEEDLHYWLGYHVKLIRFLQQLPEPDEVPIAILRGIAGGLDRGSKTFVNLFAAPSAVDHPSEERLWQRVDSIAPPLTHKWRAQFLAKQLGRVATTSFPLRADTNTLVTSSMCLLDDAIRSVNDPEMISRAIILLREEVKNRSFVTVKDTALLPQEVFFAVFK